MPHKTTVEAAGPECVRAVKHFADTLSRETCLVATVTEVPDDGVGFELDGQTETTLRVEWAVKEPAVESVPMGEWAAYEEEEDEFDEKLNDSDGTEPPEVIRHYSRMLAALARNEEAARALLEGVPRKGDGRAHRTGSSRARGRQRKRKGGVSR